MIVGPALAQFCFLPFCILTWFSLYFIISLLRRTNLKPVWGKPTTCHPELLQPSTIVNVKHRHRRNDMSYRFKSLFKTILTIFTYLTIFTSLTIFISLTIYTSLTISTSLTIFTSVTIIASLMTILALVGNLDHQVAPLALLGNLATRWHHLH